MSHKKQDKLYETKDPRSWTTSDVSNWLESLGLGKYKKAFQEHSIGGNELLDLTDNDLLSIRLNASERAKILLAIQQLRLKFSKDNDESSSSSNNTSGSGSTAPQAELNVKTVYGEDIRRFVLDADVSLERLKTKIKSAYGHRMTLRYHDRDGDLITLHSEEDWKYCKAHSRNSEIKLELRLRERPLLDRNETQVLDTMVDAVAVIDSKGIVQFVNKSFVRLLGYSKDELVRQNITAIMKPEDAAKHDEYIQRYLRTGVPHIIGIGRTVQAKKKDGTVIDAELSVSHTRSRNHDIFTGTLHVASPATTSSVTTSALNQNYALLEGLTQAAIVTNESGIIQYVNKKALEFLGYEIGELLGKNVSILMPSPFAEQHDSYMKRYITTGQAKIIGKPRELVALMKDTSIIPISLAVTEQWIGNSRYFTGVLSRLEEKNTVHSKTVLQQEREVTAGLAVPAIVIDQRGIIQGFNAAAEKLFGYSFNEVVGRNVKMLMSAVDAARHDDHIKRYLETGRTRVIGAGREVIAQNKSGDLMPVRLSVSERKDGDKRIWTGIAQPL